MRIARTIAKDGVAHLRAALAAPLASRQFSDITAEEAKSVYSSIERDASLSKFKGKDWWAAAPNKVEIFDTPEAQEIVTNYFSSLEAVCVSEEAKREVKKHRATMMAMVDEYRCVLSSRPPSADFLLTFRFPPRLVSSRRQLFKEIGKNPYLKPDFTVNWDAMRADFPGALAKQEIDFFANQDSKITPLLEEQRKSFIANQDAILFQQDAFVAYKKRMMDEVAPGLVQLKTEYDAEIQKCEDKIAQIEEDLESLDYITIEECLENNPELAKEIDEEIERQEW